MTTTEGEAMTTDTGRLYVLTDEERRTLLKALDREWRQVDAHKSSSSHAEREALIDKAQHLAHLMSKLRHAD